MSCHDAFRGKPMMREQAFFAGDGPPSWEITHDVARARIYISYTAEAFLNRRKIDEMTSVLAGQMHGLAGLVHGDK